MLRKELPKYLRRNNIHCDYVFCTGDIRIGKTGLFPDEAADYLKELCFVVGVDTSRLFIVPGNHDINRNSPGRDEAISAFLALFPTEATEWSGIKVAILAFFDLFSTGFISPVRRLNR